MNRPLTLMAVAVLAASGACAGEEEAPGSAPASLEGRTFLSTGSSRPLVEGSRVRLDVTEGTLGVTAGCNSLSGTLAVEEGGLVVSEMGGTEMGCEPDLHDQDEWLAAFLAADPSYALEGD